MSNINVSTGPCLLQGLFGLVKRDVESPRVHRGIPSGEWALKHHRGWERSGWCSPERDGSGEPLLSFSPLRVWTQLLKWPMKAHYLLVGGLNWSWNAEKQWCAETWVNVSMSAALPHGINGGINDNKLLCNVAIWPYISVVSRPASLERPYTKKAISQDVYGWLPFLASLAIPPMPCDTF